MKKIKLYTAIALAIILNSCNEQSKKEIHQSKKTEKTSEDDELNTYYPENILFYADSINQISQVVRTIFQDSNGHIWFGTQNGAFKLVGNSLTHIDKILSESGKGVTIKEITESIDGKIWLGHTDGISSVDGEIVTNYYESDGLISNDVWSIAADREGTIWIGTIEGVSKFDGKNFSPFELPEGIKDTTLGVSSTKMIHNIMEDSRGRIWFCTNGGVYIKDENSLTNLSENDGLQTPFVKEVIETQNGDFWISTSQGLYKYQKGIMSEVTNTLFEKTIGTGSIIEDSNGRIWFNNARSIYALKNDELTEYQISERNYGPLTFQIYEDQQRRLWFVGYRGAFRLENGKLMNVTKNGPW